MKVLFLSSALPHARAVSGLQIVHHRIRLLAQRGHQVGLASFALPGDEIHLPALRELLCDAVLVPRPARGTLPTQVRRFLTRAIPLDFLAWRSPAMFKCVGDMVARHRFDVVIAEFSVMGQYLHYNPHLPAVRRIVSCHSCLTSAYRQDIQVQAWSPKSIKKVLRSKGLSRFEFATYRSADRLLTLTPQERHDILNIAPDLDVSVIPYGVDVEHFRPGEAPSQETIIFTGFYRDEPNVDAAMWLANTVWPLLRERHPNLHLIIAGRDPTSDMRSLARRDPRIRVTGEVEDLLPMLQQARIFVCPMRMGTGFRGKILQAMATGVPVVATSVGAQGIPGQMAHNILISDTSRGFAESVDLLLDDEHLRRTISANALSMVRERFSWKYCVDRLEEVMEQTVAG